MALENNRALLKGVLIGAGVTVAARDLYPYLAPLARPVVKSLAKFFVAGYERSRVRTAELAESLDDIMAEVQWEMKQEQANGGTAV